MGPCVYQYGWLPVVEDSERTYHDIISVADPAAEDFVYLATLDPVLEAAVYDAMLEQRTCEQDRYQEQRPRNVPQRDGPDAEQVEELQRGHLAGLIQDVGGEQDANNTREGNRSDAGADGRGRIAGERGRWARLGREVEGRHVDDGEQDLQLGVRSSGMSVGTTAG